MKVWYGLFDRKVEEVKELERVSSYEEFKHVLGKTGASSD